MRAAELPEFKSEKEESEWWDQHREETEGWLEEATASRQTATLSDILERARRRADSTKERTG
jgi:hypothetical protein